MTGLGNGVSRSQKRYLMPQSTIRGRMVAVFAIALLGVISTAAIAVAVFTEYSRLTRGLVDETIPELRTAYQLENAAHALSASAYELIAAQNRADIERAYEHSKYEVEELERLTGLISSSGRYVDVLSLNRVSQGLRHDIEMIFVIKSKLVGLLSGGEAESASELEARHTALNQRLVASRNGLFDAVDGVLWHATSYKSQVTEQAQTSLDNVNQRSDLGRSSLFTVAGATVLIVFLSAWLVGGGLTGRINVLRDILIGRMRTFPEGYFLPTDEISEMGRAARALLEDRDALLRSQLEQEAIANELETLIDSANAPIFRVNDEGIIDEWNQKSAALTGWSRNEVVGQSLIEMLVAPDARVAVFEVIDRALHGEETSSFECVFVSKTGERVDVLVSATARHDVTGRVVGVVGVGQDITEHKRSQAQVVQASKLATLGEMATGMAHELNQPLNVIRIAVANCKRKLGAGAVDAEYLIDKLSRIDKQVKRASDVIDHMRVFGRKADNDPRPFDMKEALTGALDLVLAQFRLTDVSVSVETPEAPMPVMGHQILLEQVFLNILTNARDAILSKNPGGPREIKVRIKEDSNRGVIRAEFRDTGGGIPERVLDRIFEPFFTTKDVGQGTGLGLSISYGIVRDMGGTLTAGNVSGGGIFTVELPVMDPQAAQAIQRADAGDRETATDPAALLSEQPRN